VAGDHESGPAGVSSLVRDARREPEIPGPNQGTGIVLPGPLPPTPLHRRSHPPRAAQARRSQRPADHGPGSVPRASGGVGPDIRTAPLGIIHGAPELTLVPAEPVVEGAVKRPPLRSRAPAPLHPQVEALAGPGRLGVPVSALHVTPHHPEALSVGDLDRPQPGWIAALGPGSRRRPRSEPLPGQPRERQASPGNQERTLHGRHPGAGPIRFRNRHPPSVLTGHRADCRPEPEAEGGGA